MMGSTPGEVKLQLAGFEGKSYLHLLSRENRPAARLEVLNDASPRLELRSSGSSAGAVMQVDEERAGLAVRDAKGKVHVIAGV
jgi:hypothetical protein